MNPRIPLTRRSAWRGQLPPDRPPPPPPDTAWPVAPNPPRDAEEDELVDVELLLLRPDDTSPVETELGGRRDQ